MENRRTLRTYNPHTAWRQAGSVLSILVLWAAAHAGVFGQPAKSKVPFSFQPSPSATNLFEDKVVAKGKGVEVRQSQVDEAYVTFKASQAAAGQSIPDALRRKFEADILEKLIATQLFVNLAGEADRTKAKGLAEEFIGAQMKQAPSEEAFHRQLIAVGMTPEKYRAQILEQALVESVIDREVKAKKIVTESQVREFYDKNPSLFNESELVRVSHILFSTQDATTGKELSTEQKLEKRRLAEKILERARKGEDFAGLVKEFSDDATSKEKGGEHTISRAREDRSRAVVPEFEAAAFSLALHQVSDLVTTRYGYHIIKSLEKIPSRRMAFSRVEPRIRRSLTQQEVEKELPGYVEKLKKAAAVEIFKTESGR